MFQQIFASFFTLSLIFFTPQLKASEVDTQDVSRCLAYSDVQHLHLSDVVFYAVDKASPYDLCLGPKSNSFEKIQSSELYHHLYVTPNDGVLWIILNSHLNHLGKAPVKGGEFTRFVKNKKNATVGDLYRFIESKI